MPNYIYNVSNLQLKQDAYRETSINSVNLRNVPWQSNNMANSFVNCTNLTLVQNINSNVTNMSYTFRNCTSLTTVPTLPSSVTSLAFTFQDCNSLVNAPEIPSSVSNLSGTFTNCLSLTNVQDIPSSVTMMPNTFTRCTNLVNAPSIPDSVTNMQFSFVDCILLTNIPKISNSVIDLTYTFEGCTNIVTAPNIPNSVTNMCSTFANCTNLAGNIYIHSNRITNVTQIFENSNITKNVYIPCYNLYTNKANSITKATFDNEGYDESGTKDNTYLKNITPAITINPTPADATIEIEANEYISNENCLTVPLNSIVNWSVSKTGYITQTNTLTAITDTTLNIQLEEATVIITVTPTPIDATVTLTAPGYSTVTGVGQQSISVIANTEVTYEVSAPGYDTETNSITSLIDIEIPVELRISQEYSFTINGNEEATLIEYLGLATNVVVPDYVVGIPLNNDEADAGEITEVVETINDAGLVSDLDITDTNNAGTLDEQ